MTKVEKRGVTKSGIFNKSGDKKNENEKRIGELQELNLIL